MRCLSDENQIIEISCWDDVEKTSKFGMFHEMVIQEAEKRPKLMRALRNISATKLGVSKAHKVLDSAYKYSAADLAVTYNFALGDDISSNQPYTRLLNPRDRDCYCLARKYAGIFLSGLVADKGEQDIKEMIMAVDII
jgi:hypothetical protein